jgi:precorrin-3B synthase
MTALAIDRSRRRGACPGLSVPMQTGDGLLVRLMPTGTIPLAAFAALCAAARQHGNGIIEVTGRGSIQVRGLSAASAPRFADAIAALNIAAADGVPVLCNALAGLDPEEILDAAALAANLRRALARTSLTARLAPKISVAVDGGGALTLDGLPADVRLSAQATSAGAVLCVSVAGDGTTAARIGAVSIVHAVEAAVRLLEVIAQHGRTTRAHDLVAAESVAPFRAVLTGLLIDGVSEPRVGKFSDPIGSYRLRDGSVAVGIGLAFGHSDSRTLERLAEAARIAGAIGIRPAADRALMIIGISPPGVRALSDTAESLGFIVDRAHPRRRVVACAGAPICSSAHIAARALAPVVAEIAAPHLDDSCRIHISGCSKGCAQAGRAALTIVGSPDGCELVAGGSARDTPFAVVATNELPAAIARHFHAVTREGRNV